MSGPAVIVGGSAPHWLRALLSVWFVFGALACAGQRGATVSPQRVYAAATVDELRATPPGDDALAAARLAEQRGADELAVAHATMALRAAQMDAAIADVREQPASERAANRRWRARARVARRLAVRSHDPQGQVDAIAASPRPARHARALRRAVHESSYTPWGLERLEAVLDRPAIRAALLRHGTYSDQHAWLLDFDGLPRRFRRDPVLLALALRYAVLRERPRAELVRRARALLELDRWHVPARLVVAVDRELTAGRLQGDPWLWTDLVAGAGVPVLVRMQQRLTAHEHPLWRLALAEELLEARLVGDAAQVVARATQPGSERDAIALVDALIQLQLGRASAFESWRARHDEPSWSLEQHVSALDRAAHSDLGVRTVAAAARRRLVATRDRPRIAEDETLMRTALDERARLRLRRRARDELAAHPRSARIATHCARDQLDADACAELMDLPLWEPSGARIEGLPALAAADALDVTAWHTAAPPALHWLERSRANAGVDALLAELAATEQRGDRAASVAALERSGTLLPIHVRVGLALAFEDPASVDLELASAVLPSLDELTSFGWEDEGEHAPRTGTHGALVAALSTLQADACAAMPALRDLSLQRRGETAALLASYGAWAAIECGDDGAVAWFLARVQAGAPGAAIIYALRGEQLSRRGQPKQAARWFAEALTRDPELGMAFVGLERWAEHDADADGLRRLIAAGPDNWAYEHGVLVRTLARGKLTRSRDIAAVRALVDDAELGEAERLVQLEPELAEAILQAFRSRLVDAVDSRQLRSLAARMLALLERIRDDPRVDLAHWQHDAEGLAFVLRREPLVLDRTAARSPHDPVTMLMRARMHGDIDDAQAEEIYRVRFRWSGPRPSADAALARIVDAPATAELRAFACDELVRAGRWPEAVQTCLAAWRTSHSIALAGLAARAALGDPAAIDEAALTELFASEPPHFPAADEDAGAWWSARARHHELRGRPEAAAAAWLEAIARGTLAEDDDWAQLPGRGISIRHGELTRPIDSGSFARQAFLALLGGDVEIARAYARAAVASSGGIPRMQRHRAAHRLAFVELIAADALDRAAIIEATTLMFTEVASTRVDTFVAAHPRSRVARVIEAERALETDDLARARSAVTMLDQLDATDVLAVTTAIRTAVAAGEQPRARALFVAAARRGAHPLLDVLVVPEAVRGRDDEVPTWLRNRAAVHARLARARDDEPARYTRRSLLEQELEVWLPESWSAEPDEPLLFTAREGWSVTLESRSRASRCSGPECAQQLRRELESTGATVLWSTPQVTGAGPATELAAVFGDEATLITVIPRGGRELRLVGRAPLEYVEHMLPALRVARESFHPLDGVIGGFRAESLRRSAAPLGDDVRLRIREALARAPTKGCPIATVLNGQGAVARDSALVDAWLVTHTPQQRRALTGCAEATAAASGGIAVLALLDDDARVHAWGRTAVQAHPERARTSARTLFTSALEPALADPDHLRRPDLPPRGVLELLAALPIAHAEAMVAELIAAPTERERALGFAAAGIRRELLSRARALELVQGGDVRSAALAIDYLIGALTPGELSPIRARIDALHPTTQAERELLVQACAALAETRQPEDAPRLRRAAARVVVGDGAPEELRQTRRMLDAIVTLHREDRERRASIPTPAPEHVRPADAIDDVELARLLPGRDWFYAKVSNPRLVWSSARAALARLSGGSAADRQMVGEIVKNLLARAGTGLFADDSGIDLSRGIECATNPKISSGEVCTAFVTDRNRVLTLLAERDFGEDDGLVLPLHVAQGFAKAPRFLSALPLFLPGMLVTEEPAPAQPIVFEERVRAEVLLGPHRLYSSLIVRGHAGEIGIDEEHYLFVGERMFAFTTRRLADAVLGATEAAEVLADDPEFVALSKRLRGDAGIVGAGLGAAAEGNASTIELAVDERGLRFRQLVRNEDPIGDAAAVIAQLPPDAAATWSVGSGAPREELEASAKPSADEGIAPPAALSRTRGSIAFGWYPRAGEGLWHDWAIVLEPTEEDRRALARAKLIPRSPGPVRAGVHAAQHDRLLVYASSRVLLDRALTTATGGARARVFARGSFRGAPSSSAVNAARSGELSFRRFLSLGLGVVESAEYQADDEAGAGVLAIAGRITLALADDDRPSDVVDAWLAAHDDSNSILLPRRLQPRDLAGKLTYVLEVVEPEAFTRRVLSGSPRQGASIVPSAGGATQVRVTVSSDSDVELALSAAERRRALAPTRDYPADAARVRELVPVIIGKQTDPNKIAALVVAWVHNRIRYEITPRRIDGAKVLENGRGDCSEYATLTVTLLRAAGVPAQERSGMMASGTDMTAHAWAAYHDGKRWHEVDPTAGTASVTAGHLEMSVIDVLALDAVGGLRVLAIE